MTYISVRFSRGRSPISRGNHPVLRWSRNLGIAWEYTKWHWDKGLWGNIVVRRGKELPRFPWSIFSLPRFRVRTESWILEKVLKFAQQLSRPGKSLEKMIKSLELFFSKLQQVLYKWIFFRFGQILFNLARMFVAYNHLFDNLESEKRNFCFGIKSR